MFKRLSNIAYELLDTLELTEDFLYPYGIGSETSDFSDIIYEFSLKIAQKAQKLFNFL